METFITKTSAHALFSLGVTSEQRCKAQHICKVILNLKIFSLPPFVILCTPFFITHDTLKKHQPTWWIVYQIDKAWQAFDSISKPECTLNFMIFERTYNSRPRLIKSKIISYLLNFIALKSRSSEQRGCVVFRIVICMMQPKCIASGYLRYKPWNLHREPQNLTHIKNVKYALLLWKRMSESKESN